MPYLVLDTDPKELPILSTYGKTLVSFKGTTARACHKCKSRFYPDSRTTIGGIYKTHCVFCVIDFMVDNKRLDDFG